MVHGLYLSVSDNLTNRVEHMFVGDLRTGAPTSLFVSDNREAPVRACFSGSPRNYNFEIKCVDGTSNPYLALSAILAAGMLGVKNSSPLTMKACQGA